MQEPSNLSLSRTNHSTNTTKRETQRREPRREQRVQRTRTILRDDAVVAEKENILQLHAAPCNPQKKMLPRVCPQQGDLIVEGQLAESGYIFGPFDQNQKLLLHAVADVVYVGDLLRAQVDIATRTAQLLKEYFFLLFFMRFLRAFNFSLIRLFLPLILSYVSLYFAWLVLFMANSGLT